MPVTDLNKGVPRFSAQGDAITGRVLLKHLRWVGATTLAHALIVTDTAGAVIWDSEADGPNYIDVFPFYRWVEGIKVLTMQSGRLYAYLG